MRAGVRRAGRAGCGRGVLALLLAERGVEVVGPDPAGASLDVARAKPGADRGRWVHGDVTALPPLRVDLVTMTADVAQAIVEPEMCRRTPAGAYEALRPGCGLVFETRDPAARAWEEWNREDSYRVTEVPGFGAVVSWVELTRVTGPLVSFRRDHVLDGGDGEVTLTADATLGFRERAGVEADLAAHGYVREDVRDAPDRPGGESVCVAGRPAAD